MGVWWPTRLALLPTLLLIFLAFAACQRTDPVVKIGLVAPFEGRNRDVGYDVIYSARLAIRQANKARGPGEVRLALVAVDDFGDPAMARQSARALAVDPGIVAVIGHWLPETTAAAKSHYEAAGLSLVQAGDEPLGVTDPASLDEEFLRAYAEVTPFDEVAGPRAGAAYDGVQLIIAALSAIENDGREINRVTVSHALEDMIYDGVTGTVWQPEVQSDEETKIHQGG
ncbi:MAG: ABC transporter substrate-binding protein [Chloroflexota bacterium]|nr:MAG: ABC transporter substrate-binding protein [Chloroflexota bacterium]